MRDKKGGWKYEGVGDEMMKMEEEEEYNEW